MITRLSISFLLLSIIICSPALGQRQNTTVGGVDISPQDVPTVTVKNPNILTTYKTKVGKRPIKIDFKRSNTKYRAANSSVARHPNLRTQRTQGIEEGFECGVVEVSTFETDFDQFYVAGSESFVAKIVPGVVYDLGELQTSGNFLEIKNQPRRGVKVYVNEPQLFRKDQIAVKPVGNNSTISTANLNSAVGDLIKTGKYNGGANSRSEVEEIYTEEDLYLRVGVGGSYLTSSAEAQLEFDSSSSTWWYMYDFIDPYFTISAETAPNGIFKNGVETEDDWGYIRSVTYGRRALVMVESSEDISQVSTNVKADVEALIWSAEAEIESDVRHVLETARYTIYVYGGNTGYANKLHGISGSTDLNGVREALSEYIAEGAADVKEAKPVAYELADLNGNTVEAEVNPFDRKVRKCSPVSRKYEISLDKIRAKKVGDALDTPNFLELFGSVEYEAFNENGSKVESMSGKFATVDDYIKVEENHVKEFTNPKVVRTIEMPIGEDNAYFKLFVDAKDQDNLSKNDEYNRENTGKIYLKDLNEIENSFAVEVDNRNDSDIVLFTFNIKKIYD